jgi:hypothetical protein
MIMKKAQHTYISIKAAAGHSGFIISATILVIILFSILLLNELAGDFRSTTILDFAPSPATTQLRDFQAREAAALNSYKILDEAQGIVQIPVERAMQLIVDESATRQLNMRSPKK